MICMCVLIKVSVKLSLMAVVLIDLILHAENMGLEKSCFVLVN